MKYTVIRQHYGDKQYYEGDKRTVKNESDAKELIRAGLIADTKEEKAAPKAQNKMAKKTANKAE